MIDKDYYNTSYAGTPVEDEETFNRYLAKAERQINKYCNYYFDNHNLVDLPFESDQVAVKNSICAQIEYFNDLGGANELAGDGQVTSIHIGNTTKSFNHINLDKVSALVSEQALEYLAPTGLLYRGVGEYGG